MGAENVARLIGAVAPLLRGILDVEQREVNGQPGAVIQDHDGKLLAIMALDVLDGRIQTIRTVVNPDKLEHLGPLADVWRLREQVLDQRRSKP